MCANLHVSVVVCMYANVCICRCVSMSLHVQYACVCVCVRAGLVALVVCQGPRGAARREAVMGDWSGGDGGSRFHWAFYGSLAANSSAAEGRCRAAV